MGDDTFHICELFYSLARSFCSKRHPSERILEPMFSSSRRHGRDDRVLLPVIGEKLEDSWQAGVSVLDAP